MNRRIDLLWVGGMAPPPWPIGRTYHVQTGTPWGVHAVLEAHLEDSKADAWLFWDGALSMPEAMLLQDMLGRPSEVWHAGLRLGTVGHPGTIDFVHPTWMLNRDPDPDIEATSWRLSLRACLVRTEVLRQMGGPRPEFQSLEVAALEMGHRYIRRGVLMRHVPSLVSGVFEASEVTGPLEDEMRFIYYRFGRKWSVWTLGRALLTRYRGPRKLLSAWQRIHAKPRPSDPLPFERKEEVLQPAFEQALVSVLIPTLERYPYLRTLLNQLREQTIPPLEIIVVDQTPFAVRDATLTEAFADLPLHVMYMDEPGQCSSRNAGLQRAQGDYILFIDDDDEVAPDLIEKHLANLHRFTADVSSGVADEIGAGPLPDAFTLTRASDVFPTNNTLIRKDVLCASGLFDLAYNRGQRADGDLGMRVYLSGALMVLNPDISVLHHHAPRGGLRTHKARVITRVSSRSRILHRHLPSVSEAYLARRYFSERQVREALWIRTLSTFSMHGSRPEKVLKLLVSMLMLPYTIWITRRRSRHARAMLRTYPSIPTLKEGPVEDVRADREVSTASNK